MGPPTATSTVRRPRSGPPGLRPISRTSASEDRLDGLRFLDANGNPLPDDARASSVASFVESESSISILLDNSRGSPGDRVREDEVDMEVDDDDDDQEYRPEREGEQ